MPLADWWWITWYMYMFCLIPRPPRDFFLYFYFLFTLHYYLYVSMCVYVYVHISLFLPECVCTTLIDTSPWIFSLKCFCVSIIFVNCICPPGALIWLINLFHFISYYILYNEEEMKYMQLLPWPLGILNKCTCGECLFVYWLPDDHRSSKETTGKRQV